MHRLPAAVLYMLDPKQWEAFQPPGCGDVLKGMRACITQCGFPRVPPSFISKVLQLAATGPRAMPAHGATPLDGRIARFKARLYPIQGNITGRRPVTAQSLADTLLPLFDITQRPPGMCTMVQ